MSIMTRLWRAAILSLLAFPGLAAAVVVDYSVQGDFTTSLPLTIDGLTATAGGGQTLGLTSGLPGGLGVVGGPTFAGAHEIDTNESVLFQFVAGLATSVSFVESFAIRNAGNGLMNLEGLGAGMVSLGTVQYDIFPLFIDVSPTFGNVPLSGFRLSGNGTGSGIGIYTVSFTPVVTSIPEPTTLSLFAIGGLMGLVSRFRHRRAMAA